MDSNQHYSPLYLIMIRCDLQRKSDLPNILDKVSQLWPRVGFRGGLRGLKPPPLQVNEMRNIHFGQNTNSHLSETSEK